MSISDKLTELGYSPIAEDFYRMIDLWENWYQGDVKSFHSYSVFNGQSRVRCKRYTLGMAKKVAEDWANLLMNEKVSVTLEGKDEQEFVDGVLSANNFDVKINEMQELKSALGTVAYIPRINNVLVDSSTGRILSGANARIALDYVTAKNIHPLSWDNGIVTECAFSSLRIVQNSRGNKGTKYIYLQIHTLENGKYVIRNHLYEFNNGSLGNAVSLADVRGFENIPSEVNTSSDTRQFVIDRLNIANNVDYTLPFGVPAYANAIDILKGSDIAYDSYVNEFVLGKKRIMVKPAASKNMDGEPYFDAQDLVYYVLPEDMQDGDIIKEIDMTLRTEEHARGVQDQLNLLSSKCGFGEGHYQFNSGSVQTATQIISENSTLFRTLKKHEIILEDVLKELCRIILRLGNSVIGLSLDENVEISIDFDDSIIEDEETDFNRDMRKLAAGIINPYEFRMKWENEDEATARAALPDMVSLMGGD